MASGAQAAAWTRRVPGSALLVFFVTTIVLTFFAVEFWNVYEMAATGSLTLLAAVLPLQLIYVFYYARPVWTVHVDADVGDVERGIRDALGSRSAAPIEDRRGVLGLCAGALRVREPACAIGWSATEGYGPFKGGTSVFFVSESRDMKALLALRDAVGVTLTRGARSGYPAIQSSQA